MKKACCVLLASLVSLTFAGAVQADRGEGATAARHGLIRCGGSNFLRLSGTEVHFTSYVFRNFDSAIPITIDRMRFFDASGVVLFDTGGGPLPLSDNGVLGPADNTLEPNQTVQFGSENILPFLAQTDRPIQLELEWSAARPALSLDAITVRISRQRDPSTGAFLVERGRHAIECRTISLR